jgi:endonuclease YncB( thermonuclease family)
LRSSNLIKIPFQLPGIKINANGYSWLQTIVAEKNIKFLPLSNKGDYAAECQVVLLEPNKRPLDVGKALLSLGFAQSVPIPKEIIPHNDKQLAKYFQQLSSAEKRAKSKRAGVWQEK